MKYGRSTACLVLIVVSTFIPCITALEPLEWEGMIEPRTIQGFPMISYNDCESIDIEFESDIPVDIFIVDTQENFEQLISLSEGDVDDFTDYEKKYDHVTHKKITQDYDSDKAYYMIVFNPSETESASVTVEYEFWEDAGEEAIKEACCFGTMAVSVVVMVLVAAAIVISIKKK